MTCLVKCCLRDLSYVKEIAAKRQISFSTDSLVDKVLRRCGGLCCLANEVVNKSSDVMFRNGLLALANQVAKACGSCESVYRQCCTVRDDRSALPAAMKEVCAELKDKMELLQSCVDRLALGLNRCKQPGILNPIRLNARKTPLSLQGSLPTGV